MWERGLKLMLVFRSLFILKVAPHVGAWIETNAGVGALALRQVAPHVGAWIETAIVPRSN